MTAVSTLRDNLVTRLTTYYAGQPIQVYDTVPGQIQSPCVVIEPDSGEYDQTFGSNDRTMHRFSAIAIVALGDRGAAQDQLDAIIANTGVQSIKAAIAADHTLGGTVDWADASGYRDYGTRQYNGVDYLMATVDVWLQST